MTSPKTLNPVRTARLALTPVAIMEGMAFAATVFGNKPSKPIYELARILPHQLWHCPPGVHRGAQHGHGPCK